MQTLRDLTIKMQSIQQVIILTRIQLKRILMIMQLIMARHTGQHNPELNKSTIDQTISQINTAKMMQKSYKEIRALLTKKLDN